MVSTEILLSIPPPPKQCHLPILPIWLIGLDVAGVSQYNLIILFVLRYYQVPTLYNRLCVRGRLESLELPIDMMFVHLYSVGLVLCSRQ